MAGRAATLAKLTPPRLYAVTRRERLFSLLDAHYRHHPLVWVAGPPRAGKTSLIASYLAEQKHRTLWYHVDPGDADLATFFHYLAQAAQAAAGRKQLRLPALTPEFMADVPGFTRRFLRELWTKVPLPATLGLDNYQDLPDEAALHAMLPIVLAELPTGATLAVISRREPPSTLARELAHKLVGLIRWEDLRLTLEETRTLASSVPDVDQSIISSLHATTNGWMAGTILMLERMKTKESWNTPAPSETFPRDVPSKSDARRPCAESSRPARPHRAVIFFRCNSINQSVGQSCNIPLVFRITCPTGRWCMNQWLRQF